MAYILKFIPQREEIPEKKLINMICQIIRKNWGDLPYNEMNQSWSFIPQVIKKVLSKGTPSIFANTFEVRQALATLGYRWDKKERKYVKIQKSR